MHKPKTLLIMGKKCTVTYNNKVAGGSGQLATGSIIVGTANKVDVTETLLHECAELILAWMGLRYIRYEEGNDGIRFVMSHHEFERFVQEMAAVNDQIYRRTKK